MISLLPQSARAFGAECERFGTGSAAHGTTTEPLTLGTVARASAEFDRCGRDTPVCRANSTGTVKLDAVRAEEAIGDGCGGAA